MDKNCCPMSRRGLLMRVRFNRNVRIAVNILALGRSNQVGPTAPVTFGESKANADEVGDIETVPLRLPARRLVCRRRTPIGEVEALDPANQLGFDRLWHRRIRQLMAMGSPAQYEPSIAKLKRDIRTTGCAEPGRQIADKCQPVRLTR